MAPDHVRSCIRTNTFCIEIDAIYVRIEIVNLSKHISSSSHGHISSSSITIF